MIKQIVDFSRNEEERGAATIEVFMLADPQKHIEAIKSLISDGAIIQSVDSDTIRAKFKGVTQDKLLELIEDGWAFNQADTSNDLQCQDQADKGLCGECIEPCAVRDDEDRLNPLVNRLLAEPEGGNTERAGLLEAVEMLNTMLKEHSDEELSTLRFEATGGNYGQDRRAIIEFAAKLEERLNQYFAGKAIS